MSMPTAPATNPRVKAPRRESFVRFAWRTIRKKPGRLIGFVIIILFALMAIFGPMMYPKNLPIDPSNIYAPMSWKHPLGTDFEGTGVLSEVVTGARYVLYAAFMSGVFTVFFGVSLGLLSGYFGGWIDSIIMSVTNVFITVPSFPILVVLATVWHFGQPIQMGLVLGIFSWGGLARAIRAQTLSLRERGFVEAARGLGLSSWYIVFREIMPNSGSYIAMNLLFAITGGIGAQVGLFYLGVVPFSVNNWGVMLNLAVQQGGAMSSPTALPYLLSPLVAILLLTLGVVLFLDAVDEMFNPRLREV